MNTALEKIQRFRISLLKQIENLNTQQLNVIPAGYNNNIIWNLGHLLAAEQNMCYVKSGLPTAITEALLSPFMTGTIPDKVVDETTITTLKELLITSIDQIQSDLTNNKFDNYSPSLLIPKVYGFEVNNIHEAFEYLLYHDGLHAGYLLAMKRIL